MNTNFNPVRVAGHNLFTNRMDFSPVKWHHPEAAQRNKTVELTVLQALLYIKEGAVFTESDNLSDTEAEEIGNALEALVDECVARWRKVHGEKYVLDDNISAEAFLDEIIYPAAQFAGLHSLGVSYSFSYDHDRTNGGWVSYGSKGGKNGVLSSVSDLKDLPAAIAGAYPELFEYEF